MQNCDKYIIASVPYYNCPGTLDRAISSLLGQTYRKLIVVIVNDGDRDLPWKYLAKPKDPRLVCFELRRNMGRYFADAVVLEANPGTLHLMQDADDWSTPHRVTELLHLMVEERADAALSAVQDWMPGGRTPYRVLQFPCLKAAISRAYEYRAQHVWLVRRESLRRIGGYYAGERIQYDALLVNLLLLTGKIVYTETPLYCRTLTPDSLSRSSTTGMFSELRAKVRAKCIDLYERAYDCYERAQNGKGSHDELCNSIRAMIHGLIPEEDRLEISSAAEELRSKIVTAINQFEAS